MSNNNYDQKQNRSQQNGFTHTNFNNQVKKPGVVAVKKAQWNRFVAKTKVRLEQAKKTSKKVLYFTMVFYVIISAIITSIVLTSPLNHWYTKKNPEKIEILRKGIPENVDKMFNSYKRVNQRTTEETNESFDEEYQDVSDAKPTVPGIKTAQASTPVLAVETTVKNGVSIFRDVTAYNLVPGQTDSSPCIGAANQNLCYLMREKKMNVCAANQYEFGTILKIPEYKGSQKDGNDTCVVLDVLAPKYGDRVDICMDQDLKRATAFRVQNIPITVVGYMENWRTLAPASKKEFQEPSR